MLTWLIATGGILVTTLAAQQPQAPPKPRAQAKIQYVARQALGKGVTLARLSNGLVVLVQENHAAPVATVRCFVKNTGGAFEGKYLGMGVSHVLEHLVAGGTNSKRTEEEIRKIVDRLGGQTNAFTSDSMTAYYIDCPAAEVASAIELIADSMQHCTFPEAEYRREMEVVQRELEMGEAERRRVLYQATKELLFTTHPMRHPTIGYLAVLQSIRRQDVSDFYKDRYVPQNMAFVVGGAVRTDEVLDLVLKNFQNFQRTTERQADLPAEPEQVSPRSVRIEMEGDTTNVTIAWPTVPLQHPDLYPLDVAAYVLATGDSSRLARRLKFEAAGGGLAISVSSASYTPGFVKGWFEVAAVCRPENRDKVRAILLEEVYRLTKEPIGAGELAKAKRQKAAEHVFAQQTVQEQVNSLATSYISTGDPLYDHQYVEGIQNVTADDVLQAARRYFLPDRQNTVLIEPLGSGKHETRGDIATSVEDPVIRRQLDNGLTLLLKRHALLPMVTVQAYVRGGTTAESPQTIGLASLTAEMMDKGTKSYTAEQIAEYFDSVGGTFGLSSQRSTTFLQCAVLKEDLPKTLDYTYEVLFEPTFPADQFAKVQKIRLGQIAARKANPQTQIMDFFALQLPPDSPFSRPIQGTTETVSRLTTGDCKRFHRTYFVPNNMVLAVYGDIDPEALATKLEARFGKVPKADGFQWPSFPKEPAPFPQDLTRTLPIQQKNTALVIVGFPAPSVFDEKTRTALELLGGVLTGGGGAGGRLHEELRGAGLVYYVFSFQLGGFAPGYYLFMAQTRPETLGEVTLRIRANLERIAKEGVPDAEFQLVRDKLLAAHVMDNTTPQAQAFQASVDELYGLGHDYDSQYAERLRRITVDDLKSVVKRYFRHALVATAAPAATGNGR